MYITLIALPESPYWIYRNGNLSIKNIEDSIIFLMKMNREIEVMTGTFLDRFHEERNFCVGLIFTIVSNGIDLSRNWVYTVSLLIVCVNGEVFFSKKE